MRFSGLCLITAVAFSLFAEEQEIAMQKTVASPRKAGREERLATLEVQMNDSLTVTARGDFGAHAPSAQPQLPNAYGVFISADAIAYKQYIGGNDYAYTNHSAATPIDGTNKHLTFDWTPGFRVEAGYRFPHDAWDITARYTWLHTHASQKMAAPVGGSVQPLYPPFQSGQLPTLANASWKTDFSILDFAWDKNYFLNGHFAVAPMVGLRTAWIDQHMKETCSSTPVPGSTTFVTGLNDFWGIGPFTGVETTWFITSSWNFFNSLGGSLMVGSFDVLSEVKQNGTDLTHLQANITRVVPMLQAALGFGWEMNCRRQRNHIAVRLSYEAQYWWRQNQLLQYGLFAAPIFKRVSEDLGLHGLALNLLFDF